MSRPSQEIDLQELNRFADLRKQGSEDLDKWILNRIKNSTPLDQVALLAQTGRLHLFYEAVGKARTQGHPGRIISAAATGDSTTKGNRSLTQNYLSFCKNNNIEPVKIRGNKN